MVRTLIFLCQVLATFLTAAAHLAPRFHIDAPLASQVHSGSPPLSCGTSGYGIALIPLRVWLLCNINWLDSVTDSVDVNLSTLGGIGKDREAGSAAYHGLQGQTRLRTEQRQEDRITHMLPLLGWRT